MVVYWICTSSKTTITFELFHKKLRDAWTPKTTSYIYLIGGANNNMKFDHQQCTIRGIMSSARQFTSQIFQNSRMRHFGLKVWCN